MGRKGVGGSALFKCHVQHLFEESDRKGGGGGLKYIYKKRGGGGGLLYFQREEVNEIDRN